MTPEQDLANRLAIIFLREQMIGGFFDSKKGSEVVLAPEQAARVQRIMLRAQALAAAAFAEAGKPEAVAALAEEPK